MSQFKSWLDVSVFGYVAPFLRNRISWKMALELFYLFKCRDCVPGCSTERGGEFYSLHHLSIRRFASFVKDELRQDAGITLRRYGLVGDRVYRQVRAQVWNRVVGQAEEQARNSMEDQVCWKVRGRVRRGGGGLGTEKGVGAGA